MVTTKNRRQTANLKVAWDTGAVVTTSPQTNYLSRLEEITDVYVRGVTGAIAPIKLKGEYLPMVENSPKIPLDALHVPESPFILISISQFCKEYDAAAMFDKQGGMLWNKHGLLATSTVLEGLYVQDTNMKSHDIRKVLERLLKPFLVPTSAKPNPLRCMSFSMETLRWIHLAANHLSYNTLREIYNFPPEDADNPNPVCTACCEAGMPRPKIPLNKSSAPAHPCSDITFDITRRMPSDSRGNQRAVIACCRLSDLWWQVAIKRKSQAANEVLALIDSLNNRYSPRKVASVTTDGEVPQSKVFRDELRVRGIELKISAPEEQWQNPAEATMKRWQKAVQSMMFQSNAPKSFWSFAGSHACYVHNRIAMPGKESPIQQLTGIKPTWEPEKAFAQKCAARVWQKGKLEKQSVDCSWLGRDEFCNADIVKPCDVKLASSKERYGSVTRVYPGNFPYTHPQFPRPAQNPYYRYESDTDDDSVVAENVVPIPHSAQSAPMLAKGPDYEHKVDMSGVFDDTDIVDYDDPSVDLSVHVPVGAPRASSRTKVMSSAGAAAAAYINDSYYFSDNPIQHDHLGPPRRSYHFKCANILQSITTSAQEPVQTVMDSAMAMFELAEVKNFNIYLAEVKSNPFADLFDAKTMAMWKDPKNLKEVQAHPMREHFLAAQEKEKQAWIRNGAYEIIKRSDIPIDPTTGKPYKVMRYHEVWKTKWFSDQTVEKFKNRVTANGKYQNKNAELCYENMVTIPSLRIGFDLAVRFNLAIAHTDAMEFYLQHEVRPGEAYFMEIPEGWSEKDPKLHVMHLFKAAYGIPSAGQTAGHKLTEYLGEIGFTPCVHDSKVYVKWVSDTEMVMVMSHVDDLLYFGTSKELIDQHINLLRKKVPMTPTTWNPTIFRGVQIAYLPNGAIKLYQSAFIKEFVEKFDLQFHKTPDVPGRDPDQKFEPKATTQVSKKVVKDYMVKQGCLQWASLCTPSCAYVINWLARFMQNPQPHHIKQQINCLLYMVSIADKGITFTRVGPPQQLHWGFNMDILLGWADATWADRSDDNDARSTTGLMWETNQGLIMWYTGKQNNITLSSCESEVMANKSCCQQGIWLRGIYTDLGASFTKPSKIMQDNTGAMAMAKTDANQTKSRHYRVACAYIRECYNRRIFSFEWIQTLDMKADILTKPIMQPHHGRHERAITRCT